MCSLVSKINLNPLSRRSKKVYQQPFRPFRNMSETECIVCELEELYMIRTAESIDLFLGVRLKCHHDVNSAPVSLRISQQVYIQSVLRSFGMAKCKPAAIPMVENFSRNSMQKQIDRLCTKNFIRRWLTLYSMWHYALDLIYLFQS